MTKRKRDYQSFIDELRKRMEESGKFTGEQLSHLVDKTQAYMEAAGDLTKEELEL